MILPIRLYIKCAYRYFLHLEQCRPMLVVCVYLRLSGVLKQIPDNDLGNYGGLFVTSNNVFQLCSASNKFLLFLGDVFLYDT